VQGGIDNPPIVVATSRGKTVTMLLVSVLFAVIGTVMIVALPDNYGGYLCLVFFLLAVPVFVWRLVSPPRLEISPRGISWFNGRTTVDYLWKDFADFRAYQPSSRSLSKHLGFEYTSNCPKRDKTTAVSRALAGVDGSFGGQWEISTHDLASLLNRAKAKWGS
jgi:hypothetical protein